MTITLQIFLEEISLKIEILNAKCWSDLPLDHPLLSHSRYKINKGMLQSLQNAAATFAGMLTSFCHKLGWTCLEVLLDQFQSRLTFGVSKELCNLVRISLLSGFKARLLYDRGYETVSVLAFADVNAIATLLRESVCCEFESDVMIIWAYRYCLSGMLFYLGYFPPIKEKKIAA